LDEERLVGFVDGSVEAVPVGERVGGGGEVETEPAVAIHPGIDLEGDVQDAAAGEVGGLHWGKGDDAVVVMDHRGADGGAAEAVPLDLGGGDGAEREGDAGHFGVVAVEAGAGEVAVLEVERQADDFGAVGCAFRAGGILGEVVAPGGVDMHETGVFDVRWVGGVVDTVVQRAGEVAGFVETPFRFL